MIFRALILLSGVLLCSCASVGVKKVGYLGAHPPRQVPQRILVKPFAFYEPALNVDRSGQKLADFKYEFQEKLTRHLTQNLPDHAGPAQAIAATAPLPRGNYWLITGQFDRVEQGSRLLRSAGGFGLGATKLETSVVVSDLSGPRPEPFLLIQTSGGSNATPILLGATRTGLTFDTIRTAREITAALSEYLYQQGAIPLEVAVAPKRTGDSTTTAYDPRAWRQ